MFIRRTTIKRRSSGEPYVTFRIVESRRTEHGVRQFTVLNLGRQFDVPRPQWGPLAQRITALIGGQLDLLADGLDPQWEALAEQLAARINQRNAEPAPVNKDACESPDYQHVDLSSLRLLRPRTIGMEHVALHAVEQLGLREQLERLGFNTHQLPVAIGLIIGRMIYPASELATHAWLREHSGLGELLGYDFSATSLSRLYRVSDQLLGHQAALEAHLYAQARELFAFDETITLYDLTNTFFEGTAGANPQARRGHSKEKRSDCPLVTLALVLDASGFPKRSEIFAGNVSEPATLEKMLARLAPAPDGNGPTVVMDAGIATEDNVAWLKAHRYRYLVVSRSRHKHFDAGQATRVKDDGKHRVQIQRVLDDATGEVRLYCHSSQREEKERAMQGRFSERLEAALHYLADGLAKKRRVKQYDKVLIRIGRLKQRYASAARYYDIGVEKDQASGQATAITWSRITPVEQTYPGVYCLRTNQDQWDEATLWRTYTMLTDLEAVFRALKSELGLRPVFHHKTGRVNAHLFLSVLAYHLVHSLRLQLKAHGLHSSWDGLRRQLDGQVRITSVLRRKDGATYHIRKATRPEPRQREILDALGISHAPGGTEKTLVDATGQESEHKRSA